MQEKWRNLLNDIQIRKFGKQVKKLAIKNCGK